MKKKLPLIIINLLFVIIFISHTAEFFDFEFIHRLEAFSYDMRLNLTMPGTQDDRIVIIDIDEKSLAEFGRWPWSRDKIALMLDHLFDYYGAAVVGFDVVFAERDESSGLQVLERLAKTDLKSDGMFQEVLPGLRKHLDYNELFAQKLKSRNVVLGYYFSNDSDRTAGQLPPPVFTKKTLKAGNTEFLKTTGYGANLPELQANALSGGHFNPYVDPDGVTRRIPILQEHRGAYYEALSVAVVRNLLGSPPLIAGVPEGVGSGGEKYNKLEELRFADLKIPVDEKVCAFIPYRGKQGSFKYLSAGDVLQKRIDKKQLEGAIVLIGTSAAGLMDLRATPVAPVYPGVEIHANMIAGILDQNIKYQPAYVLAMEILMLLTAGLLLSFLLPFLTPLKATLLCLGLLMLAAGVNVSAWYADMVLPLASSALMIPLLFAVNMTYGFFTETRIKHRITGLFGQYIPKELVEEMSRNPENFASSLEGENREMTVLFSDVRNFTTISEGLPAKELTKLMNEYMTPMTYVIQKHRGTIDKYIGDAIMAFWGAPLPDEAHARNAILAALDMQETLNSLRPQFIERGWPEVRIGVGINSGVMHVGDMGSEFRRAYTVLGDAVNLGSRLEGITKEYGVGIIVGERTRNAVSDVLFRELDRVQVKGKDLPVAIYEPIGLDADISPAVRDELSRFNEALSLYRTMSWDEAERLLLELQKTFPDKYLYNLYLDRIRYFRSEPPEAGWDGVFKFTTK
ncbi:MAG: adenylate/guanylate cyclase domain-containing protein [Deltaproteobacteria bacterium]|nr:adenylate/guanylate cyclase domain-containing protein [Deltaproteobacteria bacterium]